ncbi:hypothetical protein ACSSZE_15650 [Acidithiobacillus caldus]
MKLKIFLVWLVLAAFSRSLIQIPVFGGWIVGAIALLPVLWLVISLVKTDANGSGSSRWHRSVGGHGGGADRKRREEALARSDWRFDHGRMYHSRDHWD